MLCGICIFCLEYACLALYLSSIVWMILLPKSSTKVCTASTPCSHCLNTMLTLLLPHNHHLTTLHNPPRTATQTKSTLTPTPTQAPRHQATLCNDCPHHCSPRTAFRKAIRSPPTDHQAAYRSPSTWLRLKHNTILHLPITGRLLETHPTRPSSELSLPTLCRVLKSAAHDPRITALVVRCPGGLRTGWGKLQEVRRHIEYFGASGKPTVALIERGAEREYFIAVACETVYALPSAQLVLTGFTMAGSYWLGTFQKVGIQPEVVRCGKYKAAADMLAAEGMSEEHREQLQALLEETVAVWSEAVAAGRGKTTADVHTLLHGCVWDVQALVEQGWLDGLLYEDEVLGKLHRALGIPTPKIPPHVPNTTPLPTISAHSYALQPVFTPGQALCASNTIAVIRACGMIAGTQGGGGGGMVSTMDVGGVLAQVRAARNDPTVKAVVLRVESPGGDALASDIMWREVHQLALTKPVVASLGDVAGSGGYMLAMAANVIVAEALTIAGSIGVVSSKFNLEALYKHMGYKKETLTAGGPLAGMMQEHRSMTPEQSAVFRAAAHATYDAFVTKAAASRGMTTDQLLAAAEGRVWSGNAALRMGLVDEIGGVHRALAVARHAAGLGEDMPVRVREMGGGWGQWVVSLVNGVRGVMAVGSMAGVVAEPVVSVVETVGVHAALMQGGGWVMALMDTPVVG